MMEYTVWGKPNRHSQAMVTHSWLRTNCHLLLLDQELCFATSLSIDVDLVCLHKACGSVLGKAAWAQKGCPEVNCRTELGYRDLP